MIRCAKALCLFLFIIAASCSGSSLTSSSYTPPRPELLYKRLGFAPKGNGRPDRFAVIIGANTEHRHRGNISVAYQVLVEEGYVRDQVFILDTDDSGPFFPRVDVTSRDAVEVLLGYLKDTVEEHDTLLVYITGHGKSVGGHSSIILNGSEDLLVFELIYQLSLIGPGRGFLFVDHCYAGESVVPPGCQWIVATVATDATTSQGTSFPRLFWNAFRNDEKTIDAAFRRASRLDRATAAGENMPSLRAGSCVNPSVGL